MSVQFMSAEEAARKSQAVFDEQTRKFVEFCDSERDAIDRQVEDAIKYAIVRGKKSVYLGDIVRKYLKKFHDTEPGYYIDARPDRDIMVKILLEIAVLETLGYTFESIPPASACYIDVCLTWGEP